MKRVIALFMAIAMLFLLCACNYCYEAEKGSLTIMYGTYLPIPISINPDGASACLYTWDGDESNTDIVIPDEYDSHTIKKLGGCYGRGAPAPFYIDDISWMNLHDDGEADGDGAMAVEYDMFDEFSDEWSEIVYHDFKLYLGKSIDGIFATPCAVVYTVDGVKTAYCPRVTVYCDEENDTFYSENGRLYYRENGALVESFIYAE